jgi:hypothetical protein
MRSLCRSTRRRWSKTRCECRRARARRRSGGRGSNSRRRSSTPRSPRPPISTCIGNNGNASFAAIPPPASPPRRRPPSLGPGGAGARAGRTPSRASPHAPVLSGAPTPEVVRSCARWSTVHEVIVAAMPVTLPSHDHRRVGVHHEPSDAPHTGYSLATEIGTRHRHSRCRGKRTPPPADPNLAVPTAAAPNIPIRSLLCRIVSR